MRRAIKGSMVLEQSADIHFMDPSGPGVNTLAMPKPTLAGGGRLAGSVFIGYVRLVCLVVGVTAVGLAANWAFLALVAWQFDKPADSGAILILLITFGVLFPSAYLVVGQKQGVQALLRYCYQRHESSLIDFLLLVLQRLLKVAGDAPINADNIRAALKRVDEMPGVIRFALKRYLQRDELHALALEIISDPDFRAASLALVKERYSARINGCILNSLLDVDRRTFRALACANACAGVGAWLLLR